MVDYNFIVKTVTSTLALKNQQYIAVLLPEYIDSDLFWKSTYLGILKATNHVKALCVQINNYAFNQNEPLSYTNTFKTLSESKLTAVIMVPNFSKETKLIVCQLEALIIPYLFLKIDIEGFNNITFVEQHSYTAGYIAGKFMHLPKSKPFQF